jgi:hypothetical protein
MARLPRVVVVDVPHHVTQRGNGGWPRQSCRQPRSPPHSISGSGPPLRHHDLGCPTVRDVRIVGTTGDGIMGLVCRPPDLVPIASLTQDLPPGLCYVPTPRLWWDDFCGAPPP